MASSLICFMFSLGWISSSLAEAGKAIHKEAEPFLKDFDEKQSSVSDEKRTADVELCFGSPSLQKLFQSRKKLDIPDLKNFFANDHDALSLLETLARQPNSETTLQKLFVNKPLISLRFQVCCCRGFLLYLACEIRGICKRSTVLKITHTFKSRCQ